MLKDKNGKALKSGQLVQVPDPVFVDDFWQHSFIGTVHCRRQYQAFTENGKVKTTPSANLVCVIDQDDNGWDVEANRLVIL
jgi:hypothetical protein